MLKQKKNTKKWTLVVSSFGFKLVERPEFSKFSVNLLFGIFCFLGVFASKSTKEEERTKGKIPRKAKNCGITPLRQLIKTSEMQLQISEDHMSWKLSWNSKKYKYIIKLLCGNKFILIRRNMYVTNTSFLIKEENIRVTYVMM